jgi:hypothetical protein
MAKKRKRKKATQAEYRKRALKAWRTKRKNMKAAA